MQKVCVILFLVLLLLYEEDLIVCCCFVVYSAINEALKDALNSDAYQQKVKESQGLLVNVSKLSGVANLRIENISLVADQLFCAEAHGYNNCLLPNYTDQVKELADFYVCLLIFLYFTFTFPFFFFYVISFSYCLSSFHLS